MTESTPTPAGGEGSPLSSATGAVKGAATQAAEAAQAAVGQVTGKAGEAAQQLGEGVDATVARIRELNERAITAAKAAGTQALDAYEKALQSVVEVEEKVGTASSLDWVQELINAHADFVKRLSSSYVSAIRERLK